MGSRSFEIYLWHLMVYSVALYLGSRAGASGCHGDFWAAAGCIYSTIIIETYFPEEIMKQVRANLLLLLTAMIWGAAFVAQSVS